MGFNAWLHSPYEGMNIQISEPITSLKSIFVSLNSRNNSYKYIHKSQPYSKVMKFSAKLFNYWLQDDQM